MLYNDAKLVKPEKAPAGSWQSPISAELVASQSIRLQQIALDGEDIYWIEGRPDESGRNVIVAKSPGQALTDLTPPQFNVRSRVHEYGGGAFAVAGGIIYFVNFTDQRLYRQNHPGQPEPITKPAKLRYADLIVDQNRDRLICIREDHSKPKHEPVNTIVSIKLKKGETQILVAGNDFYSSPRLNPDGTSLAWLTWNHPNMPWDGTELWVGKLKTDGSIESARKIAGGPGESVFQPEWSPDGTLYFISDRTGWWNLYCRHDGRIESLLNIKAEFGKPQWIFGMSTYAFESARRLICTHGQSETHLAALNPLTRQFTQIKIPYTEIGQVRTLPGYVVCQAGSPTQPTSIIRFDLKTQELEVIRRSSKIDINSGYLSSPEPIEFPTENNLTAHAFFYPPKNSDFILPDGEKPPLIVKSHGGPISATSATLNLEIQYFTSRGFAVLDVNYGGSSGYGRAYRQRLTGQWGIVDVDDCVNGAGDLVKKSKVDSNRLIIRGSSAGGYTTLSALTFRHTFKAGASYFGISNLESLAKETHKFESRDLDGLIGSYPQHRDRYRARSPIYHTDKLSCPIIFFQGLKDRVVQPNQAESIVAVLRRKGLPVAYLTFPDEQHGFRNAKNIKRALEAELYFYAKIFGFQLSDPIEPIAIDNLTAPDP